MSEALRLAEWVESDMTCDGDAEIVAELRRLVAENETLKAELAEQARVNGMGGEREARLMALNTELVEALRRVLEVWQDDPAYGHGAADKAWELLVKIEANNGS